MKFGENLKKLRKLKKLSQEDLAEKMQVSRQSVSKWETGDAYPEMNNILELCKIFHCRINDLVNDSIIDIDLLDEEIKNNVVKFKKEQQSKMKGLSKAISLIARIGKIICIVCVPIIMTMMILFAVVISKVDIKNGEMIMDGNSVISIIEDDNVITLKVDDKLVSISANQSEIIRIKDILQNNSKLMILGYLETGLAFLIMMLILTSVMFKKLEKLFNNINKGDTPFTLENGGYIKQMAYLMIAITILPSIIGGIFEIILKADLNVEFELFSLVEILFLFSIAYIFEYGYEIQLDSKGKMYGDEDE